MKKLVTEAGGTISIRASPDDAVAQLRKRSAAITGRLAAGLPLQNDDRDVILVAIAQHLGLIS